MAISAAQHPNYRIAEGLLFKSIFVSRIVAFADQLVGSIDKMNLDLIFLA